MNKLIILIGFILISCSPKTRLVFYLNQSDKLINKHPELKNEFKIDSLEKKDSIQVLIKSNDNIKLIKDTSRVNNLIDSLLLSKLLQDSLLKELEKKPRDTIIIKQIEQIKNTIKKQKEDLSNNSFSDQEFIIYLPVKYYNNSILKKDSMKINLSYQKGNLFITSDNEIPIIYDKTYYKLDINKDFNTWIWLKDEKTIGVLFLLILFLLIIIFKR